MYYLLLVKGTYLAGLQHKNVIIVNHSVEPMSTEAIRTVQHNRYSLYVRDCEHGYVMELGTGNNCLNRLVCQRIHSTRRLIQNDDFCLAQQCPSKAEQLPLPSGERGPALLYLCLKTTDARNMLLEVALWASCQCPVGVPNAGMVPSLMRSKEQHRCTGNSGRCSRALFLGTIEVPIENVST